uniref:ABC transporter substrate-binding protein n=1 Tax=Solibacter usitatus (strain Ellin6076) TaxID=234267 RepID=Q024A1_SOLUE
MKKISITMFVILTMMFVVAGTSTAATGSALSIPITAANNSGNATFNGVYTVTGFALQGSNVVAVGNLVGTLTSKSTQTTTSISQAVTLPVSATGSCPILHLELGPLDLNLLGLQVHLNQVVLDITAQSGPGNLLGNLLCDVANLLNNPTQDLVNLLNQIVAILKTV